MLRLAYGLGLGYLGLCTLLLAARPAAGERLVLAGGPAHAPAAVAAAPDGSAAGWFARIRPRCNAVEVEVALRSAAPPQGNEGASYAAGCYALAGKIDRAQGIIEGLPDGWRARAAGIVFEIVHPVADAGDDQSAGPMMRLVLRYWPDNFQALYHAGMAEYAVGDRALARAHLRRFLELYKADDGWTRNAREVLDRPGMKGN
jgi:hypothetical protein